MDMTLSQTLTPTLSPPGPTAGGGGGANSFDILTEGGSPLVTEAGNRIVTENAP
jgi:hypothetical protein